MDRLRMGVIGIGWFGKNPCSPEDAAAALEAMVAAEGSARAGNVVRIG